tara:strand:+ start:6529 stop:7518 length:990 start_codon:yes stop_codon:yes gene_type:complete
MSNLSSKNKAILVTGGAGFIANNLIKKLLSSSKDKIIAVDNFRLGKIENVVKNSQVDFLKLDLSSKKEVKKFFEEIQKNYFIEEIWHLAANSDIPAGIKNSEVDFNNTFLTTFNIINFVDSDCLKKFHFASSSAIYGDHGNLKIKENTAPLFPISNYGSFKLASEGVLSAFVEKNNCFLYIYRFPNVVGTPATHGVIFDFISRLKLNPSELKVFGNGKQKKQYMHIYDLIEAMIIVRKNSDQKRNVFNIGSLDEGIEVSEIAKLAISRNFKNAIITFGEEGRGWIGDIPKYQYSVDKLLSLNWKPKYPSSKSAVVKAIEDISIQLKISN